MIINNKLTAFILSHGRADKVYTYKTLKKQGFTGDVYIIIDNEDNAYPRKKTVYDLLLQNPQIIDKFISEIDKEVKKLENSFERGHLCVKETLKIEKYKTDKLLDLKNKIIKIKGNSPDSSVQGE